MLFSWFSILADETASKNSSEPLWFNFALIIPLVALFYFLMIAPMRRQEKQRQALVAKLKKNDKIINSGGIIGIVESIKEKENEVVLRGGLRVTRASIVQVISEEAAKEPKESGASPVAK
jgi:preprotein translocase subunit YajC